MNDPPTFVVRDRMLVHPTVMNLFVSQKTREVIITDMTAAVRHPVCLLWFGSWWGAGGGSMCDHVCVRIRFIINFLPVMLQVVVGSGITTFSSPLESH